jgi:nucleotide-binding universal stress UspA family protein
MPKASLFVVPVDFSTAMEPTVAAAFALAVRCDLRRGVDLLEITPQRRPSLLGEDTPLQLADPQASKNDWNRLEHSIRTAQRNGLAVRAIGYRGNATQVIAAHAQLARASLIVINRHFGSPAWRRSTRVVDDLIRSAPVPVLVWPRNEASDGKRPAPFRHIVSAIDLTVASAVALRTVLDLVHRTGARVTLVHAVQDAASHMPFSGGEAFDARRRLESQIGRVAARLRRKLPAAIPIRVDARVTTGDAGRSILEVAAEVNADLVVMGVPPRSRIDEVIFGSTLRRVLRHATVPLLVVPVAAGANKWLDEGDAVERPLTRRSRRRRR